MMRIIYLITLSIVFSVSAEAQVLKKLGKRVKERTEKKATERVEKKADKKVDQGLDGIFESNSNSDQSSKENPASHPYAQGSQSMPSSSTSKAEPAAVYTFDYLMKVRIDVAKEESMEASYLLSSKNATHAMQMSSLMDDMEQDVKAVAITDFERKASFQLMEYGGNKMLMAIDLNEDVGEEVEEEDFKIEELPPKKILNYTCKGLKISNSDTEMEVYFTSEAKVGFSLFQDPNQSKVMPKYQAFADLMKENTLVLEMQVKDKKEGYDMQWQSISLEPTKVELKTDGYKRM